jgi:hypothetical protein
LRKVRIDEFQDEMADALEWFHSAIDDEKAKAQAWFAQYTPDCLGKNQWGRSLSF